MKTSQVNESTNPENFFLEDPASPGSYTIRSILVDASVISGALNVIKKKVFDGWMYMALFPGKFEVHWRRDIDDDPIRILYFDLFGKVNDSAWTGFDFDHVGNPTEVTLEPIVAAETYRLWWEISAFGVNNVFGVQFTFTRKEVDHKFFLYSPENDVQIRADFYIRKAALAENRADNRGLMTPTEKEGVEPVLTEDTPTAAWNKYVYTFGPKTCDAYDGETNPQLFQQEMGLVVK